LVQQGFGLAVLATAATTGKRAFKHGADLLYRRMLVNVEVTRNDEAYPWLLNWISAHQRTKAAATARTVTNNSTLITRLLDRFTPGLHHLQFHSSRIKLPDGATRTQFTLVPGFGRHILRYNNAFIAVNRQRDKSFDMQTGTPFETVTLTTLYSHRGVFEDLFQEAHLLAQKMREGKTTLYTAWGPEWRKFGEPKRKRPLDSVVLEEGLKEHIINDVKTFIDSRTWYLDRGIPYRRGYLLHGPPGTGKSSFIQALAGELDFDIAILNVSERGLTDDRLNHLLAQVPQRTIVLLEDADAAFVNRIQVDEQGYSGATVTFSGLLNALDGVASGEERIVFLTTNHIERLDDALIRPGRVDMSIRLGHATLNQIERLWDRFYAEFDQDHEGRKRFIQRAQELGLINHVSTAALQGLFLFNKGNMDCAIAMASSLATKTQAHHQRASQASSM
jgi:mitochondrial chaperone BCS1